MKWSTECYFCRLLISFLPIASHEALMSQSSASLCRLNALKPLFEYEYYQEGDVMIGGLISAHFLSKKHLLQNIGSVGFATCSSFCEFINVEEHKSILAMILAVHQINKDPDLLPNLTLGYHILDTCDDPMKTLGYALQILSGKKTEAPNYSCRRQGEVAGFIGDTNFHTSHAVAQMLSLYQYTQISYQVSDPLLSNRNAYPTLFRMIQDDRIRYAAIIKCLLHFGWNWIGMVIANDGSGDLEVQELSAMMNQHGICIDYMITFSSNHEDNLQKVETIEKSTAKIVIVCGVFTLSFLYFFEGIHTFIALVTLILPESWNNVKYFTTFDFVPINCSFIFLWPQKVISDIDTYFNGFNFSTSLNDPILEDIWLQSAHCLSSNSDKNDFFQSYYGFSAENCTKQDFVWAPFPPELEVMPSYAYTAVYVLANALHRFYMNTSKPNRLKQVLHHYMREVHYTDSTGDEIYFNNRGEVPSKIVLANWVFYNSNIPSIQKLAKLNGTLDIADTLDIKTEHIFWKTGTKPESRCNDRCLPGYRKASLRQVHACCYDCVPCSDGEMSNTTDSENCVKCPDDEWPDEKKVKCLPKTLEFLSYENVLVFAFLFSSLMFSVATLFVLGNFIYNRDTPIVRANNRTVSFILLTSILLSFLCVFLFLGRPVHITCILRQTLFGIFFSIAISSVLAKTITVCIAFKATKPGSYWRKWVGEKISNCVVFICSSVQVLICVIWLSVSPPYQEYDMHYYPGKIILQCNEGSVIGFYSVLGYLGFLAAVSFVLAFMVRTLPDSFNEAKYITFSMLVFCSVWIATIPAYLSTKGKHMVAVEIFAIITSCVGILGCIFFPKCYIILLKPDLNTRKGMLQKMDL